MAEPDQTEALYRALNDCYADLSLLYWRAPSRLGGRGLPDAKDIAADLQQAEPLLRPWWARKQRENAAAARRVRGTEEAT